VAQAKEFTGMARVQDNLQRWLQYFSNTMIRGTYCQARACGKSVDEALAKGLQGVNMSTSDSG